MTNSKAHVCCSPNFACQFLAAFAALCSTAFFISSNDFLADFLGDTFERVKIELLVRATSLGWWSVVSLLSSACCALQLILNLMSVGCAGFNTVLGPVRPVLLSLAFCGQLFMWSQLKLDSQFPQAIKASVLTCVVSFMPELLYVYNRVRESSSPMVSGSTGGSSASNSTSDIKRDTITIKLENMGCIACVNTITNVLKACTGVEQVRVRLDDEEADVSIRKNECNVDDMCEQVTAIGFPASLADVPEADMSIRKNACNVDDMCEQVAAIGFPALADVPEAKVVHEVQADSKESSSSTLSVTLWAVVAGLLSSSCCALQLGLNVLSTFNILHIGCAGFNIVLGPLRTFTRSLSFGWLSFLWYRSTPKQHRHLLVSTLITLSLMFLPELLRSTGVGPALAPPTSDQVVLHFKVPNMGCEACESNVQKIIGRQNGVIDSAVNFDAGVAQIVVAKDWSFDIGALEEELTYAGYGLVDSNVDSKDGDDTVVHNDGVVHGHGRIVSEEEEVCKECELEDLDW